MIKSNRYSACFDPLHIKVSLYSNIFVLSGKVQHVFSRARTDKCIGKLFSPGKLLLVVWHCVQVQYQSFSGGIQFCKSR